MTYHDGDLIGGARTRMSRVAYVMSRFPKLTETFILHELLAMRRQGVDVRVYPLLRERDEVVHPEARPVVEEAHYEPFLSWPIIRSQLAWLRRAPLRYLRALAEVLAASSGSRSFLVRAIAIFPKVAHMARSMQREGVEHVHCHFATHPAAAGMIIHRLTGIPFSFTAHGSDIHRDRTGLRVKVRAASFVVAISEDNRRVIRDECGERTARKVEVIHCGVDTERFRAERRPGDHALRIVCVGTLHEVKGQAVLLEACRRLMERGVDFRCRLIGDGEDRRMLEDLVRRHGLHGRVELAGRRTGEEVAAELREASVLVAPSVPSRDGRREGIPVVLMEAMATGLPVVASRLSGIPELVTDGEAGLLVEPGDDAAVADALVRLAADAELRHRLGLAGRRRVVEEFDVDRNARALRSRIVRGRGQAAAA
jgi:colanic acid/amylovoran biosynthesis glycosyltransferase